MQGNSYEGRYLIVGLLTVHYHHGEEHAGIQTDMVMERLLRVLHPDP